MKQIIFLVIFFYTLLFTSLSSLAEVYKWVDSEGNIHFSDDPQDAERGEQVAVDSSNVMEGGDELAASASRNRERILDQRSKAAKAAAESTSGKYDPCAEDMDRYSAYSQVHHDKNGVPYYVYANNEDGSPMSQRDHNNMVEKLRISLIARGCI